MFGHNSRPYGERERVVRQIMYQTQAQTGADG